MTAPTDSTTDPQRPSTGTATSRRGFLGSIAGLCAAAAGGGVVSAAAGRPAPVNDPEFDRQYVPRMVRAPRAWETTRGSDDVTIGVLGTGVDYTHPDLREQFGATKGVDVIDGDDDPRPDPPRCFVRGCTPEVHGTKVAGIAAASADNGEGIAGISDSRLLNARAIPGGTLQVETVHADCPPMDSQTIRRRLARGARYLVDQGVDVLNMSLSYDPLAYEREHSSYDCFDDDWEPVWDDAIEYALENDVLVVSGAGNQGKPAPGDPDKEINYPARKEGVLAVSGVGKPDFLRESLDEDDESLSVGDLDPARWDTDPRDWDVGLWGDRDRGSRYNDRVDVAAPVDPLGPWTDRWYLPDYARERKAISWAVPVVSGVAALALARTPDLSAADLRALIVDAARDLGLPDERQGGGLVDAAATVERA